MKNVLILLICLFLCSNVALANLIVYEKPDVKIIVEGKEKNEWKYKKKNWIKQ